LSEDTNESKKKAVEAIKTLIRDRELLAKNVKQTFFEGKRTNKLQQSVQNNISSMKTRAIFIDVIIMVLSICFETELAVCLN